MKLFVFSAFAWMTISVIWCGCKKDQAIDTPSSGRASSEAATVTAKEGLALGDALPQFKLPDVNGTQVSLSSFKGNYVIIFGYDKWCNICFNNYISDSKTLYDRYNGKKDASGKGFKMVGLLGDSSSSEVLAAIQASPMLASWPQLFDKGAAVAWGYWNPNNVKGYYPGDMQVIVLDPEGKILYGATGYGTHDGVALCNGTTSISDIEALLDPVLTH